MPENIKNLLYFRIRLFMCCFSKWVSRSVRHVFMLATIFKLPGFWHKFRKRKYPIDIHTAFIATFLSIVMDLTLAAFSFLWHSPWSLYWSRGVLFRRSKHWGKLARRSRRRVVKEVSLGTAGSIHNDFTASYVQVVFGKISSQGTKRDLPNSRRGARERGFVTVAPPFFLSLFLSRYGRGIRDKTFFTPLLLSQHQQKDSATLSCR